MEVKFDLVRIGNIRKNSIAEKIIKENLDVLRNKIRWLLKDDNANNKYNRIHIVLIIPQKGFAVKIVLHDIKDEVIRKKIKINFPKNIHKGDYSIIMNNLDNKVFGGY